MPTYFNCFLHVFVSRLRIFFPGTAHPNREVIIMSYIAPAVQAKFETLSIDLKNQILEKNVQINNIYDLIQVLEEIVNEG